MPGFKHGSPFMEGQSGILDKPTPHHVPVDGLRQGIELAGIMTDYKMEVRPGGITVEPTSPSHPAAGNGGSRTGVDAGEMAVIGPVTESMAEHHQLAVAAGPTAKLDHPVMSGQHFRSRSGRRDRSPP